MASAGSVSWARSSRERDGIFVIEPARGTACVGFEDQPSCAMACPVDCGLPDPSRVEAEGDLFARALALHPNQVPPLRLSPLTSHFRAG
jgi:hypothetical protein